MGVYGGRVGVLMGFLGVPLVNGGADRGFRWVLVGLWGSDRGFDGFMGVE